MKTEKEKSSGFMVSGQLHMQKVRSYYDTDEITSQIWSPRLSDKSINFAEDLIIKELGYTFVHTFSIKIQSFSYQ